jgi:hypothetical protein
MPAPRTSQNLYSVYRGVRLDSETVRSQDGHLEMTMYATMCP